MANRRDLVLKALQESDIAISATTLAQQFNVSRQIIVGDIALLRAQGYEINATPRGYVLPSDTINMSSNIRHTIACLHDDKKMIEELNQFGYIKNRFSL